MSETRDDAPGELDDEQLSNVTGGTSVVGTAPSPDGNPGPPDVSPTLSITSPRDAGSGLPTGQRMHKPFVITKDPDPTMS